MENEERVAGLPMDQLIDVPLCAAADASVQLADSTAEFMLATVPIPNLQTDELNVHFDMEVKQSERQESDMSANMGGALNMGIAKVNVIGSVSSHQVSTRSSDNSAKYHVDVRATNHGTPEGLEKVLDMMEANVAPMLESSTVKDRKE